jgi:hypothetical protein
MLSIRCQARVWRTKDAIDLSAIRQLIRGRVLHRSTGSEVEDHYLVKHMIVDLIGETWCFRFQLTSTAHVRHCKVESKQVPHPESCSAAL